MTKNHFVAALSLLVLSASSKGAVQSWDGSSGLLPNQVNPAFRVQDTSTNNPSLNEGVLTLDTEGGNGSMTYGTNFVDFSSSSYIEASTRFVSGTSSSVNFSSHGIQFFTSINFRNALWIEKDNIFLNTFGGGRGPSVAVDTDDAFHTYRIEFNGPNISVYYDNGSSPILTGFLYELGGLHFPGIYWGGESEASFAPQASGVSEWRSFEHNTYIPEPTSFMLTCLGTLIFLKRRKY